MNKTNFADNKIPKENMYYTCIACITIESVIRMCQNENESESELEYDTELDSKSELESDTE